MTGTELIGRCAVEGRGTLLMMLSYVDVWIRERKGEMLYLKKCKHCIDKTFKFVVV